jgi:uncharacterized phage-associated protein
MLITHEREKLCQAVLFFAHHTNKLGKTKLFKLLFFLDFEHFKLVGRSVTGSRYNAWEMGPVPADLAGEFEQLGEDIRACVEVRTTLTMKGKMQKIVPRKAFDSRHFSKRELELMDQLAREYRNATAAQIIEETHLENKPWHQIYRVENRPGQPIPYDLALNRQETELMQRQVRERAEVMDNLNSPVDGSRNDSV